MPAFAPDPLPWPEAEKAFASRLGMPANLFNALAEKLRGMAWTIARITEYSVMMRIKDKLAQSIANGETLYDFTKWIEGSGEVWARSYTELVFRMATLGSYSRARWDEITDPDLGDEFGWIMYDAVNDDRTRDEHAEMDGKAWRRDEFPEEWNPPNGFNCRCEIRNLNDDLLRRSGADVQSTAPSVEPDKGFRSNQAADYGAILEEELARIRGEFGA